MLRDIDLAVANGADTIVFGVLRTGSLSQGVRRDSGCFETLDQLIDEVRIYHRALSPAERNVLCLRVFVV